MMSRVVVTGSTGFVGRALCETLAASGFVVRAVLRNDVPAPRGAVERAVIGDISSHTNWKEALAGADAVVHLAARVHVMHDGPANADAYMETNARGTLRLAQACVEAGVPRLVFLSSIKVNGEEAGDRAYSADDVPQPQDAYGSSKWAAEQSLMGLAAQGGMKVAIVRPPLIYGPGVRANFLRLLRMVERRWPLPLGAICHNRRSLVSVWNLCDLLLHLVSRPPALSGTWMVSDGHDLSTAELLRRLGQTMNRPVRLVAVPEGLLRVAGTLLRRNGEVARLCGSLVIDITRTREELGWSPPLTVDEGLTRTSAWYLAEGRSGGA
jgi:nucleoside-diphosphate-sugar epimerase